jgi:hypothetical protein
MAKLSELFGEYGRRARLMPGLIIALPLTIATVGLTGDAMPLAGLIGAWFGVWGCLAALLGLLARAAGTSIEPALWRSWGGSPTNRWLQPDDTTCSEQQKVIWRKAIKKLTGLSLRAATGSPEAKEKNDRVINDAVRRLRDMVRDKPFAALLFQQNKNYGMVRNLCGLKEAWLGACAVSTFACLIGWLVWERPLLPILIEFIIALIAVAFYFILPTLTRKCADRYADAFFGAVMALDAETASTVSPVDTGT